MPVGSPWYVDVVAPPPPPPVEEPPPEGPIYSQVQKRASTTVTPAQYARVGEKRSFDVYSHGKVTVKIQGMQSDSSEYQTLFRKKGMII